MVGIIATSLPATARTNTPGADTTQPAVAATTETSSTTATTAPTATPTADTAASTNAVAVAAVPTAADSSTQVAQAAPADSAATAPAEPASTNSTPTSTPAPVAAPADTAAAAPAAPATATPAPAPAPADTAVAAPAAPASATPAAAPTAAPAPADTAVAAPAPATPAAAPADTAAAAPAAPATPPPSNTASLRDPNAVIPLIVMDEVPLTDAIKNLARQAGLNYMLDPKINYGAAGPDGHVSNPQPTVTLRWENLTADQALNAVLNNYNMIIVDDPKTKIARITIKDPAAPDPLTTKIVQLKYAYATNLLVNVQSVLLDKRSKVIADARTSQLVVVATDKEMTVVDELIARLDTPTKQVLIEAKLVETTKNPTSTKGIDWAGTAQAQHFTFGNNVLGGASKFPWGETFSQVTNLAPGGGIITQVTYTPNNLVGTPGLLADTAHGFSPATAFLNADGVSAVLSFLNTSADAQVLSTPRAVTLDNEEATLSVTVAQPIFNTTAGTQGSPGGAQVVYTNLGTILKVTPRISANNTISLRVIPEVSDIGALVTKTVGGLEFQADSYNIRKFTTQVLIPSGNTLVMGGLVSDSRSKGSTKVPILGDIPVLGWAFRQENKSQNKRNLIIFITPTIVQNEDFQPTETSFLKSKMSTKPITDFGAWDSGEPQDWSKLFHGKKSTDADDINN